MAAGRAECLNLSVPGALMVNRAPRRILGVEVDDSAANSRRTRANRVRRLSNGRVPDYLHFILRSQYLACRESLTAGYRVQGESSG